MLRTVQLSTLVLAVKSILPVNSPMGYLALHQSESEPR